MSSRPDPQSLLDELGLSFPDDGGPFVEVLDAEGVVVGSRGEPPPLCAHLNSFPTAAAACRGDCLRVAREARTDGGTAAGRCWAGLSYRVIRVSSEDGSSLSLLVGKVPTGIYGGDQVAATAAPHGLETGPWLMAVLRSRYMSEAELDRETSLVAAAAPRLCGEGEPAGEGASPESRCFDSLRRIVGVGPGEEEAASLFLREAATIAGASDAALILNAGADGPKPRVVATGGRGPILEGANREGLRRHFGSGEGTVRVARGDAALARMGLGGLQPPVTLVRISRGETVWGYFLALADPRRHERETLELAAGMFALLLDAERGRQHRQERLEEVARLDAMAGRIAVEREEESILPLGLDAAMEALGARRGSILLLDETGERVTAAVVRGRHAEVGGQLLRLPAPAVTSGVFRSRRPLLVDDTTLDRAYRRKRRYPYESRSFISVPLRAGDRTLGVVSLTDRQGDGSFTPWDLLVLDRWGQQVAAALERAGMSREVERLKRQAVVDSLTGVPNRRHLEERLAREMERAARFQHPLSLLLVEPDGLRAHAGRPVAAPPEALLRELSRLLEECTRSVDLVARVGGGQFAAVLPETSLKGAVTIAEKVRAAVEDRSFPDGEAGGGRQTVSIGIATFPDMAVTARDLLARAGRALVKARHQGGNAVVPWRG